MKPTVILLMALLATAAACAQPPPMDEMPPPDAPEMMPGPEAPPEGGPLDRWLDRLREKDPAEYERLQQIRREGPEGFRRALHGKLRDERIMARFREFPRMCQFLLTMPEEEREQILQRMGPQGGGMHGRGGPWGGPPARNPEIEALEREVGELSRAFREAADAALKDETLTTIRQKLETLFDLREKDRQEHIARIEKELVRLKESLEKRLERREEIIERRLKELTEGDVLGW